MFDIISNFVHTEVDYDFSATSYFSNRATFAANEEGEVPTNQLNITIPVVDDHIAEDRESFVVMIELRPLCDEGVLFDVENQCSLVHISDDDGDITC